MLRNTAFELLEMKSTFSFKSLLCSNTLLGKEGFLTKVNALTVFKEDPLHKKSNLLAHLAIRAKIIDITDEHCLEPAIDYHIMRIYLRTKRLLIKDNSISIILKNNGTFTNEEINELRSFIKNTMKFTCSNFNISMANLCFVDWVLGREFCHYDNPICKMKNGDCPIIDKCDSYKIPQSELLKEPLNNLGHY